MTNIIDRVKETSTTTGTGDFTLAGAATAHQTFNAAFGTQNMFSYCIAQQAANEWETGWGYLSASTTLVRYIVKASSNSGNAVNFSAGTKDVFHTITAAEYQSDAQGMVLSVGLGNYFR